MATQFKIRRDTAANWTAANPTLASGEPALETDTRKQKIGDGVTPWNSLAYSPAAIDASVITSGAIPTSRIADGAISTVKLADGSVTSVKLAAGSVSGDKIADAGVSAAKLSAAEQANLVAGKLRSGGASGGAAITVFVQSSQPTALAAGDLWFW